MDSRTLGWVAVAVVFAMLYGSRLNRGSARQTPEGTVFALKPMVLASQVGALLLYLAFLVYTLVRLTAQMPIWFYAIFALAVGLILLRLPGTILLGPDRATQTYWMLGNRTIPYADVTAIAVLQAGRATRVVGANGVAITHTGNHAASAEFRREIQIRTGKSIEGLRLGGR